MVPLAEQDPSKWNRALIQAAEADLQRAAATPAYDKVLSLTPQPAERILLQRRRAAAMTGASP